MAAKYPSYRSRPVILVSFGDESQDAVIDWEVKNARPDNQDRERSYALFHTIGLFQLSEMSTGVVKREFIDKDRRIFPKLSVVQRAIE